VSRPHVFVVCVFSSIPGYTHGVLCNQHLLDDIPDIPDQQWVN